MKKSLALILAAAMLTTGTVGCGDNAESSKSQGSAVAEEVPENVNKKLTDAINIQAVAVPEGGWTDEALLDVIYVNGEKLNIPFTLCELGEGFDIDTSGDNFIQREGKATAALTYYGMICGLVSTQADATADDFASQNLSGITFYKSEKDSESYPEIYPISVNGVTIGTKYDDMVARLGFTVSESSEDPNTSEKSFTVTGMTDSYYVRIIGRKSVIDHITIAPKNEG